MFRSFNSKFSIYQKSNISDLALNDTLFLSDSILSNVLHTAYHIYETTDGYFNPTLGPVIRFWGFSGGKTKRTGASASQLDSLKRISTFDNFIITDEYLVKTDSLAILDLNGIAKGYAIDQIANILEDIGCSDYLILLGGEVRVKGKNATGDYWKITIQDPFIEGKEIQTKEENLNISMATSGTYRNKHGEIVHHIIDPKTLKSSESSIMSATVFHTSCMIADAVATAMIAAPISESEKIIARFPSDIEVQLLDTAGNSYTFKNF